ncbi:hypothetical protein K1T71_000456 [Dendrolimus kikuchii]|uniref:Uncharacterized protein n=1 Tax=Dendrolimus kikuchii TaxID=765133 RepID=A0ACC1DK38_9NEOP|nr:hypothetical protein K1T71_000456 [Dendrolimus kikuchii]
MTALGLLILWSKMIPFWKFIRTPRLYVVHGETAHYGMYKPNAMEKWGDKVLTWFNAALNVAFHISPILALYICRYGFILESRESWFRVIGCVGGVITFSHLMRAYGRARNAKYIEFITTYKSSILKPNFLEVLRQYDFEFTYWPASFQVKLLPNQTSYWNICLSLVNNHPYKTYANIDLPFHQRIFIQTLAFVSVHTFGLRLIYPGCLSFIYALMSGHLLYGRKRLVEEFFGKRTKIGTADGNFIDTMFVDNRGARNGKILVICCEGNSGFYEDGVMISPIKAGYSTLGWNHPGFGWSTGLPHPSQEMNAVDAVMQYAIKSLRFTPGNIVLYGWSIGGYPAAWIACNYPIRGVILDATFDDLLPLALKQMPQSWSRLVTEVIRSYANLDIATLLMQYKGPVKVIRRTEDEIICLKRGDLSTNRGNDLVQSIIFHRYLHLFDDPRMVEILKKIIAMTEMQRSHLSSRDITSIAESLLRLVSHYMYDYKSAHCVALPESYLPVIINSFNDKVVLSEN